MEVSTTDPAYRPVMEAAIYALRHPPTLKGYLDRIAVKISNTIERSLYDVPGDELSCGQLDKIRKGNGRLGMVKMVPADNHAPFEVRRALKQLRWASRTFEKALDAAVDVLLEDVGDGRVFPKRFRAFSGLDRRMELRAWDEGEEDDDENAEPVWVGKVRLRYGGVRRPKRTTASKVPVRSKPSGRSNAISKPTRGRVPRVPPSQRSRKVKKVTIKI